MIHMYRTLSVIALATGVAASALGALRQVTWWMVIFLVVVSPQVASAVQQDAEYYVQEKRFGEQWAAEDKQVREKLAALEKKFGKKPNVIYILADDTGYTELGRVKNPPIETGMEAERRARTEKIEKGGRHVW